MALVEIATSGVARKVDMQVLMIFVVLLFSAAIILYALPLILYIAPVLLVGLAISLISDTIHHHKAKTAGH